MLAAPRLPEAKEADTRLVHVVGAAIFDAAGRCLAARRAPHVASAGYWEFPGGKVEPGEDPRRALEREIAEELSLEIAAHDFLGRGEARLAGGRHIVLDVYLARLAGSRTEPSLTDHDAIRWLTHPAELAQLTWAAADLPILPALARRLADRHFDGEDGAAGLVVADRDGGVVVGDDAVHDRQAEP